MRYHYVAVFAAVGWVLLSGGVLRAEESEEPAELLDRVKTVEEKLDEVESRLPAEAAPAKNTIWSKFSMNLGGYVNLDASYDLAATNTGNFLRWIESEGTDPDLPPTVKGEDDDEFNATINATRLYLNIDGPGTETLTTNAKVEIDFYGGGGENSPNPRVRHAYFEMKWPELDFELLFGQTWDVLQPLHTPTVNYSVGWWMGNIGFRRPQARATKGFQLGENTNNRIELVAAAARTISDPFFTSDVGGDSGFPTGQFRVELQYDLLPWVAQPMIVGASGHYGEQECDEFGMDYETFSYGLHIKVPVHDKVTLQGEAWRGQSVCVYLGSIGQGINRDLQRPIDASGGWGAITLGPFADCWDKNWIFNTGASVDDPWDIGLNSTGPNYRRSLNFAVFSNAIYQFNEAIRFGLELTYAQTEYKGAEKGDSVRVQTQFRFSF